MLVRASRPRRRLAWPSRVATVALLAAMASPAAAGEGFHPLDSTLEFLGVKTEAGPMPDFVRQSRPDVAAERYMSVGAKPVDRALKPKSPAEVKAATAELDAARAAQLGGKRPKPFAAAPARDKRLEAETGR